jgi:RimJ/RimL family protein N-acetyltransferase
MRALNLIAPARTTLLETERLILRRYERDDLDRLDRLNSNVEVMRYIGDGSLRSREQSQAAIVRTRRNYDIFPGLGFWVAEEKPQRKFAGVFALFYIPKTVEVEVGYRLAKSAWGRGLATEGASALVRYGIFELGLDRVVGLTHPDNAASQNVLMKAGLLRRGMGHYYDRDLCYFVAEGSRFTCPHPGPLPGGEGEKYVAVR